MDSSRNSQLIHVIIFVTSLRSVLLIDLVRGPKNFTTAIKAPPEDDGVWRPWGSPPDRCLLPCSADRSGDPPW
jgi:hypothetical protein